MARHGSRTVRKVTLTFNLENETDRKIWEALRKTTMGRGMASFIKGFLLGALSSQEKEQAQGQGTDQEWQPFEVLSGLL